MKSTGMRVTKVAEKLQALLKSGKYCEFTVEWILSKKQIKHRRVHALLALPVCVGHSNLIEI